MSGRPFTAEDDALILKMRADGMIVVDIAARLGRSYGSTQGRLLALSRGYAKPHEPLRTVPADVLQEIHDLADFGVTRFQRLAGMACNSALTRPRKGVTTELPESQYVKLLEAVAVLRAARTTRSATAAG